jgi:hypothetical protein
MAMEKLKYGDKICVDDDFYGKLDCKIEQKIEEDVYMADCHSEEHHGSFTAIRIDKKTKFKKGQCE